MDKITKKQEELLDKLKNQIQNIKKPKQGYVLEMLADKCSILGSDFYPLLNSIGHEFGDFLNLPEFDNLKYEEKEKYGNEFKDKILIIAKEFPIKYL